MKQRIVHVFVLVSVAGLFGACGGSGGGVIIPPPPVVTSVSVTCVSTTLVNNKTTQCTATPVGTGSFSPNSQIRVHCSVLIH